MMKKVGLILTGVGLMLGMSACTLFTIDLGNDAVRGSGQVVEEYRPVENIKRIELAMDGTLYLEQGGGELLRVDAEDNLQAYILSEMRGETLVLRTEPGVELDNKEPIKFYLVVKNLEAVELFTSGDIRAGELESEALEININSSGEISIASLAGSSLRVNLNSSGGLEIRAGQVEEQDITINSSGDYHAEDLVSAKAYVYLNSNGSAYIRVSDSLTGILLSSGDIHYYGSPEVDVTINSSGKVKQEEQ